jgi:hypothetical protein
MVRVSNYLRDEHGESAQCGLRPIAPVRCTRLMVFRWPLCLSLTARRSCRATQASVRPKRPLTAPDMSSSGLFRGPIVQHTPYLAGEAPTPHCPQRFSLADAWVLGTRPRMTVERVARETLEEAEASVRGLRAEPHMLRSPQGAPTAPHMSSSGSSRGPIVQHTPHLAGEHLPTLPGSSGAARTPCFSSPNPRGASLRG